MASSKKFKPKNKAAYGGYMLKDKVALRRRREGIIRYIGKVKNCKGIWFGIEITNKQIGQHNGTLDNIQYFKCKSHKGIFVQSMDINRKKTDKITASKKKKTRLNSSKTPKKHKRTESSPPPTNNKKIKKRATNSKKLSVADIKSLKKKQKTVMNGLKSFDKKNLSYTKKRVVNLSELIMSKIDEVNQKYPGKKEQIINNPMQTAENKQSLIEKEVNSVHSDDGKSDSSDGSDIDIDSNIDIATHINITINTMDDMESDNELVIHPLILSDFDKENEPKTDIEKKSEIKTVKNTKKIVNNQVNKNKKPKKSKKKKIGKLSARINKFETKKSKKVGKINKKISNKSTRKIKNKTKETKIKTLIKKEQNVINKKRCNRKIEIEIPRVVSCSSSSSMDMDASLNSLSDSSDKDDSLSDLSDQFDVNRQIQTEIKINPDKNGNGKIESKVLKSTEAEKLDRNNDICNVKVKRKTNVKINDNMSKLQVSKKKLDIIDDNNGHNGHKSKAKKGKKESAHSVDYDGDNCEGDMKQNVKELEMRIHPFIDNENKICLLCNEGIVSLGCCFIRSADPNTKLEKIRKVYEYQKWMHE